MALPPRRLRRPALLEAVAVACAVAGAVAGALAATARPMAAQQRDSARAGVAPTRRDTGGRDAPRPSGVPSPKRFEAPVTPFGAFWRSFLLPGWGQAVLDRPVAGAVFGTAEALSVAMIRKAAYDLREARRYGADSVIVSTWRVVNGREVLDSLGRPAIATTTRNRWTQDAIQPARATFREDWAAALVFIHLISGVDAFISAQLWDLPAQVAIRPAPMGGATLAVTYRIR